MLKATERAKGTAGYGRPNLGTTKTEAPKDDTPILAELGINYKTSSLAQKLATLLEAEVTAIKTSVRTGNSITKAAKDTDKPPDTGTQAEYRPLAHRYPIQCVLMPPNRLNGL